MCAILSTRKMLGVSRMTNEQLWQAVLGELELLISRPNFTTWFTNTFIVSFDDGVVCVGVPNEFTKAWLENKYHEPIVRAVQKITGVGGARVEYRVESAKTSPVNRVLVSADAPLDAPPSSAPRLGPGRDAATRDQTLNPRYTFEAFVTGKSNELAHAACLAVAERPGLVYNPLFIYGGAGLGKTHLMQAIGHAALSRHPDRKVLYVSSEKFTNEFIQAISRGNAEKFKQRYRSADVLLVDDIQFLAGKEGTQEEFFHTFNTLHQANRQIVLTSDRPPKSIPALENRLVSRFEWGMIADIAQPDLETRIAILSTKCKEREYSLPSDILHYIGSTVQSNIRELEGALNRVVAFSQLNNTAPTLESTKHLLSSVARSPKRGGVTPKQIVQTVAEFFELSIADLVGTSRKKELVVPRQIAMFLMREEIQSSFPSIGLELGGRDHTTAMHACTKIAALLNDDERLKQNIALLLQRLYNA